YLHSHMTGVLSNCRDRGVGRMLKLFQRDEALSRGIRLIQWTFDPLELRNAHFNLNRLGAICRQYLPNLYGTTTSPLHRGLATDRAAGPICWLLGATSEILRRVSAGAVMKIQEITLRELSMKLVAPFETSMDRLEVRRIVLLEAKVDGVTGWGECVAAEAPFYSPEYADTAWPVLRDFLWPMVKGRKFDSACEVWNLLTRVRGHDMAKACLEAAAWDAEAKQKGVPLAKLIGG